MGARYLRKRPHRAGGEEAPMSEQEYRQRSIELLEGIGESLDGTADALHEMEVSIGKIRDDIDRIQMTGLEVKKQQ